MPPAYLFYHKHIQSLFTHAQAFQKIIFIHVYNVVFVLKIFSNLSAKHYLFNEYFEENQWHCLKSPKILLIQFGKVWRSWQIINSQNRSKEKKSSDNSATTH